MKGELEPADETEAALSEAIARGVRRVKYTLLVLLVVFILLAETSCALWLALR